MNKNNEIIKSPIFYMGNKYKLLNDLLIYIPKENEVNLFIDLFGGSGVVGANVPYKNVLYNELNDNIYNLFKMLNEIEPNIIIKHIKTRIKEFNLKKEDEKSYIKFRKFYNESNKNILDLFTLTYFSFSNLIRFNSNNDFNMPVGNQYFKKGEHDTQIKLFCNLLKQKNLIIKNEDAFKLLKYLVKDNKQFIYLDPPYTNTLAIYNEQRAFGGWTIENDYKLFKELDRLDKLGIKWLMSNVLENKGVKNTHIEKWANENNYTIIDLEHKEYSALGKGNANTREVLILNYEAPYQQYSIFDFMD